MAVTNFQVSISGANWIDVSSRYTIDTLPDRIPDALAITNSLYNLFTCPVGSRGRIFEPTYGSLWYQFLQEPIDDNTASKMQIAMIQAIARWEPRINLDYSQTTITPNYDLPGYDVRITGTDTVSGDPIVIQFVEIP